MFRFIAALLLVPFASSLMANIFRNDTYHKAVFVKRFENHKITATPIKTIYDMNYDRCSLQCLRHSTCKSFNLQTEKPLMCELLDRFVFDPGTHEFFVSGWNHYDPGPVLLPCLARLYNMPDSLAYNPYGNGGNGGFGPKKLTMESEGALCDMKTDGGKINGLFMSLTRQIRCVNTIMNLELKTYLYLYQPIACAKSKKLYFFNLF